MEDHNHNKCKNCVPQAYPSGIVDEQLRVLGSVSRVATLDDITKWSITKIDTLSALMAFGDGPWETAKVYYGKRRLYFVLFLYVAFL